jgi:hypothetical protein
MIDFMGHQAVTDGMARQKANASAINPAGNDLVRRISEGRLNGYLFDLLQTIHFIQSTAPDHSNGRLVEVFFNHG